MRIIDADTLKKTMHNFFDGKVIDEPAYILRDVFCLIDGAKELGYEDGVLSVKDATRRAIELEEAYNNGWSDGFSEGENARPQGEWIFLNDEYMKVECPFCHERKCCISNYCDYCGAKMQKGSAE